MNIYGLPGVVIILIFYHYDLKHPLSIVIPIYREVFQCLVLNQGNFCCPVVAATEKKKNIQPITGCKK